MTAAVVFVRAGLSPCGPMCEAAGTCAGIVLGVQCLRVSLLPHTLNSYRPAAHFIYRT